MEISAKRTEDELSCEECERWDREREGGGAFRKRVQIKMKIKHKKERRKNGEEYNIVTNVITFVRLVKMRSTRTKRIQQVKKIAGIPIVCIASYAEKTNFVSFVFINLQANLNRTPKCELLKENRDR